MTDSILKINSHSFLFQRVTATWIFQLETVLTVLANVNADQSSSHLTVMNAMSAIMVTLNVSCVTATPMELMEMYVR